MNLPNRLTMLRMGLVPVFLVFMLVPGIRYNYLWALLVFAGASFTDLLDGHIARKRNLVTDFGKFMDPLADKILVMSAMLCFVALDWAPAVVVIIILAREFLVTSLRLIAAGKGTVIAADKWGKYKTVCQMAWVIVALLATGMGGEQTQAGELALLVRDFLMWLSLILTVNSGFNYVWKNRSCIKDR